MSFNNAFSQLHDVFTHHYLHSSLHFFQRIFSTQPVSTKCQLATFSQKYLTFRELAQTDMKMNMEN